MGFLSDNVIPDDLGTIFSTNAAEKKDLKLISESILTLNGIKDVIINDSIFPIEFTIHTSKLIKVEDIEQKVLLTGFHAIPKSSFNL